MSDNGKPGYCPPSRDASGQEPSADLSPKDTESPDLETIEVPAAPRPILGTARPVIPNDGEELRRAPALRAFRITPTTITNAQFARFVDATGYVTEAERFGWSFVF